MQPNICAIQKVKGDMAQPQSSSRETGPPQSSDKLPPEILEIIWPALQVGGLSGMSGMLVGGFAGVIRSTTPTLFALASGIQWFTLGTTFWASRGFVIHVWGKDKVGPGEKVSASAIAGGVGGTAGGLLRGRGNVIPGAIVFALFGATGQAIYNWADARNSEVVERGKSGKKNSILNSKWSPMKVLSDSEYENMLREKLLRVNAQIALVNENIEALRAQERQLAAENDQRLNDPKDTSS
ncbi:hypothetical protein F5882DRAFT_391836 [Hyaloscypha sp. PMI_1271]|nr:hypothetical protein F5882DRAFT_391836 [Hyaloscypha sp. PMI_1271]